MSREDNSISFGVGLLAGILGGIAAGVLYAPKSGEESREELMSKASDLSEKYSPEVQEAKKQALESIERVKYNMEKQYKELNNAVKSSKLAKAKAREAAEDNYEY